MSWKQSSAGFWPMTVGATQLNVKKCIKPRKIETDHTDHGENQFVSTVERTQMKEIILYGY